MKPYYRLPTLFILPCCFSSWNKKANYGPPPGKRAVHRIKAASPQLPVPVFFIKARQQEPLALNPAGGNPDMFSQEKGGKRYIIGKDPSNDITIHEVKITDAPQGLGPIQKSTS